MASLEQGTTNAFSGLATSHNISLGATATAGNLLVSWIAYNKDSGSVTGLSGWSTAIVEKSGASVTLAFSWKKSDGTEQAITWSNTTSQSASIRVAEYSGFTDVTLNVSAAANSADVSVTSQTTGTTVATTQATATAFAIMGADSVGNVTNDRAWTNSFAEQEFEGADAVFSFAIKELTATGAQESTFSTTSGGDQMAAMMLVFAEAGVSVSIPVIMHSYKQRRV